MELTSKQATVNHNTIVERSFNYCGPTSMILRHQLRPKFLKWLEIFSWLFGSHDNPLTRIIWIITVNKNHGLILRRRKGDDSRDTMCCVTVGDTLVVK